MNTESLNITQKIQMDGQYLSPCTYNAFKNFNGVNFDCLTKNIYKTSP